MSLNVGDQAPAFEGIDQDGYPIKLSDFAGKKLALYFYPKDNTPGCTAQACNLRDNYDALLAAGYAVESDDAFAFWGKRGLCDRLNGGP